MKKYQRLTITIVLIYFQHWTVAAQSNSPFTEMDRMITARQFQQAYELGTANLGQWEGEPEFDFLYGLAALESGFANESVFAFERVAADSSNRILQGRARLELARAYFATNNLTASENLFIWFWMPIPHKMFNKIFRHSCN